MDVSRILVSVVYTYAIIIEAAKTVQASDRWCNDEKINTLQFSAKWIRNFLTSMARDGKRRGGRLEVVVSYGYEARS